MTHKIKVKDLKIDDSLGPTVQMEMGNKCIECGENLDGATPVGNSAQPKAGDISMCLYCGNIMAFNADQTLRPLTDEEQKEVPDLKEIQLLIKARKCQLN